MNDPTKQLFDRLGGEVGMLAIVNDMYDRILADEELKGFFETTDVQRLRRMQYHFLAAAFGGPVAYSGAELTRIHAGRGIGSHHFNRFCNHFVTALEAASIDSHDIDMALVQIAMFRDKITGAANVDG
ncbi:MAG: group 1 truncated hemoglobin [Planctomycetales bacterium]|nr:group 1 truncated hemoglobin [Planctomycetales bacterium]